MLVVVLFVAGAATAQDADIYVVGDIGLLVKEYPGDFSIVVVIRREGRRGARWHYAPGLFG
jgi:hypothetical protein